MPATWKDNSSACISEISNAVRAALGDIGEKSVGYAQEVVPVDTGALRDSLGYEASDNEVTIYAGQPYSSYVELGTSRQAAQPYLRPSVMNHTDEYKSIIANKVKGVL